VRSLLQSRSSHPYPVDDDEDGEEEEEEAGENGSDAGGSDSKRRRAAGRRAAVVRRGVTSRAVAQPGERVDLEPMERVPSKPMMELKAGSNVWYQAYLLKESQNEVKVRFPCEWWRGGRVGARCLRLGVERCGAVAAGVLREAPRKGHELVVTPSAPP
jgi:hypothetical protein